MNALKITLRCCLLLISVMSPEAYKAPFEKVYNLDYIKLQQSWGEGRIQIEKLIVSRCSKHGKNI